METSLSEPDWHMGMLFKAALGFVIALSLLGKPLPFGAASALRAVKNDLSASRPQPGPREMPPFRSGTEAGAHRLHS
jgi:hypothetical protein